MVGASDAGNGLRDAFTKNMQGFSKTIRENGQSIISSNPPQTETSSPAPTPGAHTCPRRLRRLKKIWKKAKNFPAHILSACTL
jgi:hypothetical protein